MSFVTTFKTQNTCVDGIKMIWIFHTEIMKMHGRNMLFKWPNEMGNLKSMWQMTQYSYDINCLKTDLKIQVIKILKFYLKVRCDGAHLLSQH